MELGDDDAGGTPAWQSLPRLFSKAASDWGSEHLVQCGVNVSDAGDLLPTLASKAPDLSPHDLEELDGLINGPTTSDDTSEYGFVAKYNASLGQVWAALHRLTTLPSAHAPGEASRLHEIDSSPPRPNADADADPGHDAEASLPSLSSSRPPPRSAARKIDPNMVSSTRMRVASSSSPGPSSQGTDHDTYIPPTESRRSGHYTEDLTVRFISTFIRHVLYTTNDAGRQTRVDFDDWKRPLKARKGGVNFTSIDDGGLRVTNNGEYMGRIAILEAKPQLGPVVEGVSPLSERWRAQIVGEALASRLVTDWNGPDDR